MRDYSVVDAHYDLGPVLYNRDRMGETQIIRNHLLNSWKDNGVSLIVGAIYIDDIFIPDEAYRIACEQIELIRNEIAELDALRLVTSSDDFDAFRRGDDIGIMLSLEGLAPIGSDLSLLDALYDQGIRMAGLTWSRDNAVAHGSRYSGPESPSGLTSFGKEVVRAMNRKGMIIDISHLNDAGIDDLEGMIIASHSNARGIHGIARNLKDDHIRRVTRSGGVIGINGVRMIVGGDESVKSICGHIAYMSELVGSDHICLGLDLCNELFHTDALLAGDPAPGESIDVLAGYEDIPQVIEELDRLQFSKQEIRGILGENYLRFLQRFFD